MNKLNANLNLKIFDGDIDDIMSTALEGGITYWCHRAEVVGGYLGYLGDCASEQISRGGKLKLYDSSDGKDYILTRENFMEGLKKYIEKRPRIVYNGGINAGQIDAEAADCIIQYAIFGELMYSGQ